MYNWRAPGNTCISALHLEDCGSVEKPINSSKGCGGVMRVAPVGCICLKHVRDIKVCDGGCEMAANTHGHPLGYIPAAAFVHIIVKCVTSSQDIESIVEDATRTTVELFHDKKHIDEFEGIMKKAVRLAHEDMDDLDAIREIGQGWVAEETLAIAVYCSIKYQDDFTRAVTASVNHDGDSDSTGAVTGKYLWVHILGHL